MPIGKYTENFLFAGSSYGNQAGPLTEFDTIAGGEYTLPVIPATQQGTLTTRTSDSAGVVTLQSGHAIATSDIVDLYWDGGARYGMEATVAGDEVTVSGGTGDALPPVSTALTMAKQVLIDPLCIDGNKAQIVGIIYRNNADPPARAQIDLRDSGNATVRQHSLVTEAAPGGLVITDVANGDTNIYAGNPITKAVMSHNSVIASASMFLLFGLNTTN